MRMAMLLLFLVSVMPATALGQMAPTRFCAEAPHDRPCAAYPADQTEFRRTHDYMLMSPTVQTPFDVFAWQGFVAVTWREGDRPAWQDYTAKSELIGHDGPDCEVPAGAIAIDGLHQADGHPLIDAAGNFVVYDTRLNPAMADHVRQAGLDTLEGQRRFAGEISFPMGEVGVSAPSVMLKFAWRVFAPGTDLPAHIAQDAVIRVPGEASLTGEALCVPARLGLVGLHIVSRTRSGNGGQWIWTTFEHEANAPLGLHARDPNSIFARDLFPEGCGVAPGDHAFAAGTGALNTPPPPALWSAEPPHARLRDGRPAPPARLARCWDGFDGTQGVNDIWRAELAGDVRANYRLVVAQWRGTLPGPLAGQGEVPRYASNITMESYIQTREDGSCLSCHASATDATGRDSNFTFVLREAR